MFFGKVSSMNESRLCYILVHSDTVDGVRSRGACFGGNYRSTIKKDLEEFSIHSECWKALRKYLGLNLLKKELTLLLKSGVYMVCRRPYMALVI